MSVRETVECAVLIALVSSCSRAAPHHDDAEKSAPQTHESAVAPPVAAPPQADAPFDRTGFDLTACADSELAGIKLATPVDYIAVRTQWRYTNGYASVTDPKRLEPPVEQGLPQVTPLVENGIACKSARNKSACRNALETLRSEQGWPRERLEGGSGRGYRGYVVYTRGDTIGTATTFDQLVALLGPFDNLDDVAMLLREHMFRLDCSKPNARVVDDGFEVIATAYTNCGLDDDESLLYVTKDGRLLRLSKRDTDKGTPTCI